MATTVNDVVKQAYSDLGVIREGGSINHSQLTYGINKLNDLIDSLNLDNTFPYYNQQEEFSLVASTSEYTIGTGGTFNTTRPLEIKKATIIKDNITYPVEIVDYQTWMDISDKTDETQLPYILYYETNFALGKIYLYPTPSEVVTLNIASEKQLGQYSSGDTFTLPPGYKKALTDALTMELWEKYPDESIYDTLAAKASKSMGRIKGQNFKNLMVPAQTDFHYDCDEKRRIFGSY